MKPSPVKSRWITQPQSPQTRIQRAEELLDCISGAFNVIILNKQQPDYVSTIARRFRKKIDVFRSSPIEGGAKKRGGEMPSCLLHMVELLRICTEERNLMARLAASKPQFSNPIHVWEAEKLRDKILTELRVPLRRERKK
jgi:hypothetical protein